MPTKTTVAMPIARKAMRRDLPWPATTGGIPATAAPNARSKPPMGKLRVTSAETAASTIETIASLFVHPSS